jgi:hypothetical protein
LKFRIPKLPSGYVYNHPSVLFLFIEERTHGTTIESLAKGLTVKTGRLIKNHLGRKSMISISTSIRKKNRLSEISQNSYEEKTSLWNYSNKKKN